MDFTWIVVSLAGWALALVFVLLLMRMAGQQDRAARHSEKRIDPFSDVTITKIEVPKLSHAYGGESSKKTHEAGPPTGIRPRGGSQGTPET